MSIRACLFFIAAYDLFAVSWYCFRLVPFLQKCLDMRHPKEVVEVARFRRGLLVAPHTEKKDLGGACPDIFLIHAG